MIVSLIAALDRNRVIGAKGKLPWHFSADLARFKKLTMGKPVIMGRKTYESLNRKPLPGRTNAVISRDLSYEAGHEEVIVAGSLEEAFEKLEEKGAVSGAADDEVFIIGGEQIYKLALPAADRIYLTEIDAEYEGDVYFPDFEEELWEKEELGREKDEKTGIDLIFNLYARKK